MIGLQFSKDGEIAIYEGITYGWNAFNQPSKMVKGSWKPIMSLRYPEMPIRLKKQVLVDLIKVEVKK